MKQHFEYENDKIRTAFEKLKKNSPERLTARLNLSWSNWGFGLEPLAVSARRLAANGVKFIELHGNHYGADIGYKESETKKILADAGIAAGGICGMFSRENDLSSPSGFVRQQAIDYLKRTIDFAAALDAGYVLIVPGAVGRPLAYDASEFERSAAALRTLGDRFLAADVKAAIEPIRSAEVSFCHTIAEAQAYIEAVAHPGIRHINGDAYHMQSEEAHIGAALATAGEQLLNLHMADSNRCALGDGSMDLDTIIMALYVIGFNRPGCYVTPEPLGPGGDPYPAMHGKPDAAALDRLVRQTVEYFRQREDYLLTGA
ncbi:MAG: sugar phosphate isomerase/epimerase family protein [Victivallaceae bacterium]